MTKNIQDFAVFLDMDGVLNSHAFFTSTPPPPEHCTSREMFLAMIDSVAVAHLKWLLDRSRADVVLSSSWRCAMDPTEVASMLRERGLGADWLGFVGETPTPKAMQAAGESIDPGGRRGREIDCWLRRNNAHDRLFVILDDDSDMEPLMHRLIQTKYDTGLQREHVERALSALRAWPP